MKIELTEEEVKAITLFRACDDVIFYSYNNTEAEALEFAELAGDATFFEDKTGLSWYKKRSDPGEKIDAVGVIKKDDEDDL